ncbi:MAG: hypothetical protein ACE5JZ_04665 [Kiloniellales bacterium]
MAIRRCFAAIAVLIAVPLAGAEAAPQMLGVVAGAEPKPLHCADGTCTVEFSAFCLQRERDVPAWGTVYTVLEPAKIELVAKLADDNEIRLPVGDIARITSARGHWAVTVALPEAVVRGLDASEVGISVGELVSLVPEPVAGDPNPLSQDEIAFVADALRAAASPFVDGDEPEAVAAGVVNDLINALPSANLAGSAARHELWGHTFGTTRPKGDDETGVGRAAAFYDLCQGTVAPGDDANMRRCLEIGHDGFMSEINQRYWNLVDAGV